MYPAITATRRITSGSSVEGDVGHHRHHRLRPARTWRRRLRGAAQGRRENQGRRIVWHRGIGEGRQRNFRSGVRRSHRGQLALADAPEKINKDPHGAAWLMKIKLANPAEIRLDGRRRIRRPSSPKKRRKLRPDALPSEEPIRAPGNARRHRRAVGRRSVRSPFRNIPPAASRLHLPGPLSETEIIRFFHARAAENARGYTSFLGAGVYDHLRSVVTDALIQRGEFLTSYTPYQAEISQGTLQAIFEFQTLMCQLTGQEVANASMYDGSTAITEAVLMAERLTGRHRVLVARSRPSGIPPGAGDVREEPGTANRGNWLHGVRPDRRGGALRERSNDRDRRRRRAIAELLWRARAGCRRSPRSRTARRRCSSRRLPKAVSLGIVRPPAEADIVAMEAQSFGMPPSYGGPYVGVIATREKFVRQMPGRLAGQTTDAQGRRGFVPDAGHARAAHPPRKGHFEYLHQSSALRAGRDDSSLPARQGRPARDGRAKFCQGAFALGGTEEDSRRAARFLRAVFNEFVVEFPRSVKLINARLLRERNHRPVAARPAYPELTKRGLVCVTETMPRAEIERLAADAFGKFSGTPAVEELELKL